MKRIALFLGLLALTGCQKTVSEMSYAERNELAKTIAKRCAEQGFADGHPQQRPCIKAEVDREVASREINRVRTDNARIAISNGLGAYGQALQNNAATYNANRPVTCTTTPQSTFVGGTPSSYHTSCY